MKHVFKCQYPKLSTAFEARPGLFYTSSLPASNFQLPSPILHAFSGIVYSFDDGFR
jgi:hypothetical protein